MYLFGCIFPLTRLRRCLRSVSEGSFPSLRLLSSGDNDDEEWNQSFRNTGLPASIIEDLAPRDRILAHRNMTGIIKQQEYGALLFSSSWFPLLSSSQVHVCTLSEASIICRILFFFPRLPLEDQRKTWLYLDMHGASTGQENFRLSWEYEAIDNPVQNPMGRDGTGYRLPKSGWDGMGPHEMIL